jgi:hypothetical protein
MARCLRRFGKGMARLLKFWSSEHTSLIRIDEIHEIGESDSTVQALRWR